MKGTVKWYDRVKGFGFITGEDGKDYFLHYTSLPQNQDNIRKEDSLKVTFETKDTEKGVQASNIVFSGNEETTSEDEESTSEKEEKTSE